MNKRKFRKEFSDKEFQKFLKDNGHIMPNTFFGAWAWYEAKKREFREKCYEGSTVGRTDRQD